MVNFRITSSRGKVHNQKPHHKAFPRRGGYYITFFNIPEIYEFILKESPLTFLPDPENANTVLIHLWENEHEGNLAERKMR